MKTSPSAPLSLTLALAVLGGLGASGCEEMLEPVRPGPTPPWVCDESRPAVGVAK